MRYYIHGGHFVPLHVHEVPQLGVVISGTGVHRLVLPVVKDGRRRTGITEFPVRAGDGYYIPAATPHSFMTNPGRPVVLVDIMVGDPRAVAETGAAASVTPRRRLASHPP